MILDEILLWRISFELSDEPAARQRQLEVLHSAQAECGCDPPVEDDLDGPGTVTVVTNQTGSDLLNSYKFIGELPMEISKCSIKRS